MERNESGVGPHEHGYSSCRTVAECQDDSRLGGCHLNSAGKVVEQGLGLEGRLRSGLERQCVWEKLSTPATKEGGWVARMQVGFGTVEFGEDQVEGVGILHRLTLRSKWAGCMRIAG